MSHSSETTQPLSLAERLVDVQNVNTVQAV